MSLEMSADYVLRAMEKAILKEVPKADCPIKEAKNVWMRDRIREIIKNRIESIKPSPSLTK